jgi:8-oxo-dGTP pyrophosphatase MutT (NUDIX family)
MKHIPTFSKLYTHICLLTSLTTHLFVCTTTTAPTLEYFHYRAAGVLPVYTHNGKKWAVLAREAWGKPGTIGTYDSFAGSRKKDEHDPAVTAARECAEELITHLTMGKDSVEMRKYIDSINDNTERVIASKDKEYVLYVVRFDQHIDSIKKTFYSALKKPLPMDYKEKDKLAFVSWSQLRDASKHNSQTVQALVQEYNPTTKEFELVEQCIKLRPILLGMLKLYFNETTYTVGADSKVHFY